MYKITENNDHKHLHFKEVLTIYEACFPKEERNPESRIIYRLENKLSRMFVVTEQDTVIAFAFVAVLNNNFLLLDYIAVSEKYQNKGIGSLLLKFILDEFTDKKIILEVENPAFGANKLVKEKRIAFYKRFGIKIFDTIRYILPPLDNTKNYTEMLLMYYYKNENLCLTSEQTRMLLEDIYLSVYQRQNDDEYFLMIKY